jgi:hypothetical protein
MREIALKIKASAEAELMMDVLHESGDKVSKKTSFIQDTDIELLLESIPKPPEKKRQARRPLPPNALVVAAAVGPVIAPPPPPPAEAIRDQLRRHHHARRPAVVAVPPAIALPPPANNVPQAQLQEDVLVAGPVIPPAALLPPAAAEIQPLAKRKTSLMITAITWALLVIAAAAIKIAMVITHQK